MSQAPQTITIVETRLTTRTLVVGEGWPQEALNDPQKAREYAAHAVRASCIDNIQIGTSEVSSWVTIDGLDLDEIGRGKSGQAVGA